MTTIAFDGKTIAADGRETIGWRIVRDDYKKIHECMGYVFAFSGKAAFIDPLINWVVSGADPKDYPADKDADRGTSIFVVRPDGVVLLYPSGIAYATVAAVPFAMGNGCEFALGAMRAGKSAREAVEIACTFDVASGGVIQTVAVPLLHMVAAE